MSRADYLLDRQISPAVLAAKPKLVDRYSPDPARYAEVLEVITVSGRPACYRILTWGERSEWGPSYFPRVVFSLTQVRAQFAAWVAK